MSSSSDFPGLMWIEVERPGGTILTPFFLPTFTERATHYAVESKEAVDIFLAEFAEDEGIRMTFNAPLPDCLVDSYGRFKEKLQGLTVPPEVHDIISRMHTEAAKPRKGQDLDSLLEYRTTFEGGLFSHLAATGIFEGPGSPQSISSPLAIRHNILCQFPAPYNSSRGPVDVHLAVLEDCVHHVGPNTKGKDADNKTVDRIPTEQIIQHDHQASHSGHHKIQEVEDQADSQGEAVKAPAATITDTTTKDNNKSTSGYVGGVTTLYTDTMFNEGGVKIYTECDCVHRLSATMKESCNIDDKEDKDGEDHKNNKDKTDDKDKKHSTYQDVNNNTRENNNVQNDSSDTTKVVGSPKPDFNILDLDNDNISIVGLVRIFKVPDLFAPLVHYINEPIPDILVTRGTRAYSPEYTYSDPGHGEVGLVLKAVLGQILEGPAKAWVARKRFSIVECEGVWIVIENTVENNERVIKVSQPVHNWSVPGGIVSTNVGGPREARLNLSRVFFPQTSEEAGGPDHHMWLGPVSTEPRHNLPKSPHEFMLAAVDLEKRDPEATKIPALYLR